MVSILSIIVLQLILLSIKSTKQVQQKYDVTEIMNHIRSLTADVATCTINFAGINVVVNGTIASQVTNKAGTVIHYQEGQTYTPSKVKIIKIDLISYIADGAVAPDLYQGVFDLKVVFDLGDTVGPREITRMIKIRTQLKGYTGGVPPNQIDLCSSFQGVDGIWTQKLDGTIYYMGGNVGVKTNAPTESLSVSGNIAVSGDVGIGGDISANGYWYTSDRSFKKDFLFLHGLDLARQLEGVRFTWKKSNKKDIGLVAQEVEKILPELVSTDSKTGYKSVKMAGLIPILLQSVKELELKNKELHSRVQHLESALGTADNP